MFANTTITLTVPDISTFLDNNDYAISIGLTLLVAAILTSIVVEVLKRKYNNEEGRKLAKRNVAILLTVVSSVFTFLGSVLVVAQENASILSTLPFVGEHVGTVVGVAFLLYSFKFNKLYIIASTWLNKWTKDGKKSGDVPAVVNPVPSDPSQFV